VRDGPLEVIDHRNQVLEEILGAVLNRFLALAERSLAEVLELGLQAQQAIVGVGELFAEPGCDRFGLPLRNRLGIEQAVLAVRARLRGGSLRLFDRVHRRTQRRLELGIDRDRAALVRGRLRLPAVVALATHHPSSLSVMAREQKATSGITRE
jgi:hypothetical protein